MSLFFLFFLVLFISNFFLVLSLSQYDEEEIKMIESRHESVKECDFRNGKWVYDESYPLYDSKSCPYLSSAVTCKRNGRPDSDYEKWRWKPRTCTIPRFDALQFLGKMRRKRIMFVGDSIMRNQWESLVCLLQSVIPIARKIITRNGPTIAFHALDFETSIEFSWAPFLVELKKGAGSKRILHLDSIEENAKYWRGANVLVYDSAHWWTHSRKRRSWDMVMENSRVYTSINPMIAYEKGLVTWAKWIELNIDPRMTRVFFRSMSPRHNRENGWKCYKQREPEPVVGYFRHHQPPDVTEPLVVLKGVLRTMNFPVYLQDITIMSALRKDGHPSVYAKAIQTTSDCTHWCLPGVPDTWNEIFNAML